MKKLTEKQLQWIRENTLDFDEHMIQELQDPEYEQGWLEITLQDFLEDGDVDTFIRCLTYVVRARGRGEITRLSKDLKLNRANISDIVNGKTKPHLDTALKLLNGLGYKYEIKLKSA